ncbi:uncharacterized protein B0I36DRAFT_339512 [Microdochium trichocladiopsis]|uniref:Secreted protein n=1 Tax=Microdochium trichocladiopsis TaxID=1682393 RepID=A0A9P8XRC7_9PEZI|nr:uncharacterized protein B0I36DRAFT_339512 [Microdochium trichocladiopsis]KAH7012512.1 hypothetical protein B0I36DRAFT_339512 [Microdochium trichocladiopsis]
MATPLIWTPLYLLQTAASPWTLVPRCTICPCSHTTQSPSAPSSPHKFRTRLLTTSRRAYTRG